MALISPNSQSLELPANAPLHQISLHRSQVIRDALLEASSESQLNLNALSTNDLEDLVTEALYFESHRLETKADPVRDEIDLHKLTEFSQTLKNRNNLQLPAQAIFKSLCHEMMEYHLEEIAGHFDPKTYALATRLVPRGFWWLLKATSLRNFQELFVGQVNLRRNLLIQGQTQEFQSLAQKGTVILVPTHFSNLDSVLMGWSIFALGLPPFAYGAGLNLFSNPFLGYFMNRLGAYKVDRRKKHKLYREALLAYSTVIIANGCHSLFFPGGGRARSGGLERNLKLGLLSTALSAYIKNPTRKIYLIPCVISYHFVLEASSLIHEHLQNAGGSRYVHRFRDESYDPKKLFKYFMKFFRQSGKIYLNFGQAMDPFGHYVDPNGRSYSDAGREIDPLGLIKSRGQIIANPKRDREYVHHLAERITERFTKDNVVLSSHFMAWAYFTYLRKKFEDYDLFRLLQLPLEMSHTSLTKFFKFAEPLLAAVHKGHENGAFLLEPALRSTDLRAILDSALRNIGVYHNNKPLALLQGETLQTEDWNLLYYYSNRMVELELPMEITA